MVALTSVVSAIIVYISTFCQDKPVPHWARKVCIRKVKASSQHMLQITQQWRNLKESRTAVCQSRVPRDSFIHSYWRLKSFVRTQRSPLYPLLLAHHWLLPGCEVLRWASLCVCLNVCLSACMSIRLHISKTTCPDFINFFSARCTCSCSYLTTVQYVMYFRFCGWRYVFT